MFLADSGPTHVFHDVCIQVRFCPNFPHSDAEVRRPAAHSACLSPEALPCRGEEDPMPSKPVTSFLPCDPDCLPHDDQPSVSTHHITPLPALHSNALLSKGDSHPNEMVPRVQGNTRESECRQHAPPSPQLPHILASESAATLRRPHHACTGRQSRAASASRGSPGHPHSPAAPPTEVLPLAVRGLGPGSERYKQGGLGSLCLGFPILAMGTSWYLLSSASEEWIKWPCTSTG